MTTLIMVGLPALFAFAAGYVTGAYRQREYIKRRVKLNDWEWTR